MSCPICAAGTSHFAIVPVTRTCEDHKAGPVLAPMLDTVAYARCNACGLIFCPEMREWSAQRYAREIYNAEYATADPDYAEARPAANAALLLSFLDGKRLRHLDYGGGNGGLAARLRDGGGDSTSYDSFVDGAMPAGPFDLVTAFEVMEHVPDPLTMLRAIESVSHAQTVLMFSTLLADGAQPGWWYMAPRNGHVMLYTRTALQRLFAGIGWRVISVSPLLHFALRQPPPWLAVR